MKTRNAHNCRVHVLVCTNERPSSEMVSCAPNGAKLVYDILKYRVASEGLVGAAWITRTHCLGFCNAVGTTVAIYARGRAPRWFTEVGERDIDLLWEEIVRE